MMTIKELISFLQPLQDKGADICIAVEDDQSLEGYGAINQIKFNVYTGIVELTHKFDFEGK